MNDDWTRGEQVKRRILLSVLPAAFRVSTFHEVVLAGIDDKHDREIVEGWYQRAEVDDDGRLSDWYRLIRPSLRVEHNRELERLLKTFKANFSGIRTAQSVLTRSALFSHRISRVDLGKLKYLVDYKKSASKPQAAVDFPLLEGAQAVFPTKTDGRWRLRLPEPLPDLFDISEYDMYWLATSGIATDLLLFLKAENHGAELPSYRGFSPLLFEDEEEELGTIIGDEVPLPTMPTQYIWADFQDIYRKKNQFYLDVPQRFVEPLPVDTILLDEKDTQLVQRPAYAILHDPLGNFAFQRILYVRRPEPNTAGPAVLSSEVPLELQPTQKPRFSSADLYSVKLLAEAD